MDIKLIEKYILVKNKSGNRRGMKKREGVQWEGSADRVESVNGSREWRQE